MDKWLFILFMLMHSRSSQLRNPGLLKQYFPHGVEITGEEVKSKLENSAAENQRRGITKKCFIILPRITFITTQAQDKQQNYLSIKREVIHESTTIFPVG